MVALTQNKIWVSLTRQPAPTHLQHPYEKRPKISKKTLAEHCSTQSSTGREWMPQGAVNGVHGGAEPAVAALVGASGVKMMRWSAMLNGGVASP